MVRLQPIVLLNFFMLALLQASFAQQAGVEERFFSSRVYPLLEKAGCRSCHTESGVGSSTRLRFPEENASVAEIETFGLRLQVLVDPGNPRQSLLLQKPTNRVEHTGGQRITESAEEEILLAWVNHLARLGPDVRPVPPETAPHATAGESGVMRRLTHSQYNNTVRDLLGDLTRPATQFPQEDFVHGFKNQLEVQSIPPLLAEAYSAAAEKLARNAFRHGDAQRLVPCRPTSVRDAACRDRFIREFGLRAFRRPLTANEKQRYAKLFRHGANRHKKFLAGAQMVVEAMLQSPNFLFRMERSPIREWNGYVTASRLSYFLWDTMPDEETFARAAAGKLNTETDVEQTARLMLKDARARRALEEFVSQWLRFDRVLNTVKDRRLFPQFNPGLAAAMTEETRRLVADLVWNRKNFMSLFTADYGFLNSDLASLYQFPAPPEEFAQVQFPTTTDRAGVLGHASFLTLTSKPEDTSPTERGLFIREHFLCQKVPSPPPGVNSNLPPLTEDKPRTHRERLQLHLNNESCSSCHRLVDPIGFGFEKFDAIGQRRERLTLTFFPARGDQENRETKKVELDLDTRAKVQGILDSEFSSPKELGAILANNRECQMCIVRQLFRYAHGRPENPDDRPALETAFRRFKDSQFQFQELMINLAKAMVALPRAEASSLASEGPRQQAERRP
jgi:hypothetical protein